MATLFGTAPNESPTNGDLGSLAYQDQGGQVGATLYNTDARVNTRPSLDLNFARSQVVDSRIDVSRSTPKSYQSNEQVLSEENFLKYSEDFTNRLSAVGWVDSSTTTVINNELAPDSNFTADTVTATGTNTSSRKEQTYSTLAVPYYFSVYAKAGTNNFVQLGAVANGYANFDVLNGTVGVVGANATAGIEPSANGFFRVWIEYTSVVTGALRINIVTDNNSVQNEANSLTTSIILWGAQLEQSKIGQTAPSAYVPTEAYPVRNYLNALRLAPANTMPIEYDAITGDCKGIFVESTATNLFLQSENLGDAVWSKTESTIITNSAVAPDGTLFADQFIESANSASHGVSQVVNVISGTTYVYSFYIKPNGRTELEMTFGSVGFGATVSYAIDLETARETINNLASYGYEFVGNGWYRVWASAVATATANPAFSVRTEIDNIGTYLGNGYSGVLLWGAQLEASTLGRPSSYIKTEASQVTRNADNVTLPVDRFGYNQAEGTVVFEGDFSTASTGLPQNTFTFDDGTGLNQIRFRRTNVSDYIYQVIENNLSQSQISTGITQTEGRNRLVAVYSLPNTEAFCSTNGKFNDTKAILTLPLITKLSIGSRQGTQEFFDNYIRQITYYPKALEPAQAKLLSEVTE